jgi:hypothetical protein
VEWGRRAGLACCVVLLVGITNDTAIRKQFHVLWWIKALMLLKQRGGSPKLMMEKYEAKEGLSEGSRLKGKKKWVVEN